MLYDEAGALVAEGHDLAAEGATPISRLTLDEGRFERENIWPTEADLGTVVILPGGEAGSPMAWWHADDERSWRWEFRAVELARLTSHEVGGVQLGDLLRRSWSNPS